MKITVSQLRKIIREEVQKNLTEAKLQVGDKVTEKGTDSGWWEVLELIPDNRTGKTVAKLQMFQPVGGKKPITHVTTDKLAKVRESLSRSAPLKAGGVVNRDSGEILDMDTVPPQYQDHVEIDAEGYTTLPNEQFEQLRGELSGTKPKKQWKAPFQLNREKMGEAKGPKVPQTRKPKLGDIYKNKAGHQISVEFLDGNSAGWELLARGKPKSLDGTTEELQAALTAGGFQFDRNENVY